MRQMVQASFRLSVTVMGSMIALHGANAVPVNLLDLGNRLIRVDSAAPGTIASTVVISGLRGNDTLLGFDYRPASPRVLYGLGASGQVYAVNPLTGSATPIGTPVTINGTAAGIDFNPSVDRIRVVTNTNQNLRINPDTGGLAATDTQVAYAPGDAGAGIAPRIAGAAYSNNSPGATPTTLYVIDVNRGVLATQGSTGGTPVSPNGGQLFTVGALGVASNDNVGFDIGRDGTVLASFTQPGTGTTSLYSVNLGTGAATLIGTVGTPGRTYLGLAIAPAPFSSFGATANQINLGIGLDNFTGAPSAALNALFVSLDGLAPGDRAGPLSQLTPAAYSLLPELTLQTAEFQAATVQRYLRDFRSDATGGTVSADGRIGAFLVASGRYGRFDAGVDRARVDISNVGLIGGVDYRIGDRFLVGVMGGYDRADPRLGNAPKSAIKSYFGGGYASFSLGQAFVDVFGSYGEADYDLRRGVAFGTTAYSFQASTHSRTWLGGGTIGYNFDLGGIQVEPFAGVRYADLRIDGFDEGSGVAALGFGRDRYKSLLGNFGMKLGASIDLGNAVFRPEVRGAYRREFRNDGSDAFGFTFAGPGIGALPFSPTPLRRSYATAGAGFTVSGPTSPLSVVVDYTGEFASDRKINGITGGLRLVF